MKIVCLGMFVVFVFSGISCLSRGNGYILESGNYFGIASIGDNQLSFENFNVQYIGSEEQYRFSYTCGIIRTGLDGEIEDEYKPHITRQGAFWISEELKIVFEDDSKDIEFFLRKKESKVELIRKRSLIHDLPQCDFSTVLK